MARTKVEKVELYSKRIGENLKEKFDSIRDETEDESMLMFIWTVDDKFLNSVIVGDSEKLSRMFVELMTHDEDFYQIVLTAVEVAKIFNDKNPFGEISGGVIEEEDDEEE